MALALSVLALFIAAATGGLAVVVARKVLRSLRGVEQITSQLRHDVAERSVMNLERIAELLRHYASETVFERYRALLHAVDHVPGSGETVRRSDIRDAAVSALTADLNQLARQGGSNIAANPGLMVAMARSAEAGAPPGVITEAVIAAEPARTDLVLMVNITWQCGLSCPYCWHRTKDGIVTIGDDSVPIEKDVPPDAWIKAFDDLPPSVIDFVGGEPFNYRGWIALCSGLAAKHRFAITTNLHSDGLDAFIGQVSPRRCYHITASYHPNGRLSMEEFLVRLEKFRKGGFDVCVNVVDFDTTRPLVPRLKALLTQEHGIPVFVSPWEDPYALNGAKAPQTLTCNAGMRHAFINNNGDIYRCLTNFRYPDRDKAKMGNLFAGDYAWATGAGDCDRYCELYYIVDPEMRHYHYLNVRPKNV